MRLPLQRLKDENPTAGRTHSTQKVSEHHSLWTATWVPEGALGWEVHKMTEDVLWDQKLPKADRCSQKGREPTGRTLSPEAKII